MVEVKPFDMEKEANSQGYEEHSYDAVVALNVIRAAKDPLNISWAFSEKAFEVSVYV
jgi:hypothetical protein